MKKRILQLIGSFHQGGSERQAVEMTRLLKKDGTFEIFAATLNKDGILRAEIEGIGLSEIPEFPLTSFYNANFVWQVMRCAKYLRENKIDLINTHDFYTNIFGMAAATLARVPTRIAAKRETGHVRSGVQEFVERIAFGRANAIIVNSEAVREHLIERSVPARKIHTIYNGVDLDRFTRSYGLRPEICSRFGLPAPMSIRFVTMVANLRHKVKNVPMLLRTAKRLGESHPDVHFIVAGEGELETELKEMARRLDVAQNVHFIGRCTDVPSLLSVSYACVLTSMAEGFSNAILEYMAAGKPVIATLAGGAAEAIVDGETGYLVPPDDDEAMAKHLITLLSDEQKAMEMGAKSRRIVAEKFTAAAQLANTLNLYRRYLSD